MDQNNSGTPKDLREAVKRALPNLDDAAVEGVLNAIYDRLAQDFGIAQLMAGESDEAHNAIRGLWLKIFKREEQWPSRLVRI